MSKTVNRPLSELCEDELLRLLRVQSDLCFPARQELWRRGWSDTAIVSQLIRRETAHGVSQ